MRRVYAVPIQPGPFGRGKEYEVQLDTGSVDLWLASTDCHSAARSDVPASNLSKSDTTRDTGQGFQINYFVGERQVLSSGIQSKWEDMPC